MKTLLFYTFIAFCMFYNVRTSINVCIPTKSTSNYHYDDGGSAVKLLDRLGQDLREQLGADNDDFVIGHVDFDVKHPAIDAQGSFDNLVLHNLTKFDLCLLIVNQQDGLDLFNITLRDLYIDGDYEIVDGDLGDLFKIFGHGLFWLRMRNFSMAMTNFSLSISEETCFDINIDFKLTNATADFDGFLGDDEEINDLFNDIISNVLPDAIEILWQEAKDYIESEFNKIFNRFYTNPNFVKLLRTDALEFNSSDEGYCISTV